MKFSVFKYSLFITLFISAFTGFIIRAQESITYLNEVTPTAEKKILIEDILIEGNQRTNLKIIFRELKFSKGNYLDTLELITNIEESRKNLLRLPLFNFVTITTIATKADAVIIKIDLEERWFLWPQINIYNNDRNFNTWIQNKDFSKLDYRLSLKKYNLFGLNHILTVGYSDGYTKEYAFAYQNVFIDKNQHHFIGFSSKIYYQKSAYYKTFQNKQMSFLVDNGNALSVRNFRFEYDYRPQYNSRHSLFLSYNNVRISDSLATINPMYLGNNLKQINFFDFRYQFIFDKRDSRSYPVNGYYYEINLIKTGIGLIPDNSLNLFSISGAIKQFYNITGKFYASHSISIKKSFSKDEPYYFKSGLGYKDFIRGFEYYVVDCNDFYLLKNTLKFEILPVTISNLNFIPVKKFRKIHYSIYLTSFFDVGYADEHNYDIKLQNSLSNRLLFSGGIGLDIASYYDKVIRFEYSLNSLGEPGLFIHFKSSI